MDPESIKTFKELDDLYKIMGIEPTEDEKIIKKAYRKKALLFRPDKNQDPNEIKMFLRLGEAYKILMNPELKAKYDLYKDNQKYHKERMAAQNEARKRFTEDLEEDLEKRGKANKEAGETDKKSQMTKEEQKREWEEEEQKLKEELQKKRKIEETEGKECTLVEVKWPKDHITSADRLKIIFRKYGEIKDLKFFSDDQKAVIEFKTRLSAEIAYEKNKEKESLKVSLSVTEKATDQPVKSKTCI